MREDYDRLQAALELVQAANRMGLEIPRQVVAAVENLANLIDKKKAAPVQSDDSFLAACGILRG